MPVATESQLKQMESRILDLAWNNALQFWQKSPETLSPGQVAELLAKEDRILAEQPEETAPLTGDLLIGAWLFGIAGGLRYALNADEPLKATPPCPPQIIAE